MRVPSEARNSSQQGGRKKSAQVLRLPVLAAIVAGHYYRYLEVQMETGLSTAHASLQIATTEYQNNTFRFVSFRLCPCTIRSINTSILRSYMGTLFFVGGTRIPFGW